MVYVWGIKSPQKWYILGFGAQANILTPQSLNPSSPPWVCNLFVIWFQVDNYFCRNSQYGWGPLVQIKVIKSDACKLMQYQWVIFFQIA